MKTLQKQKNHTEKLLLIASNIILLLAVIFFSIGYSASVREDQEENERETFCATIETMKEISIRYLDSEKHYVDDWVAYIEQKNMTEDEALEYLREANSRTDRYAHIVDMDTFEARSADKREDGGDSIDVYREFSLSDQRTRVQFVENMRRIFDGQSGVLGKYRIREN